MRQNEIINEKEVYKLNAKLKEYKYIIHEQKNTILELDQEMQQQQAAQAFKEQDNNLGNSFVNLNQSNNSSTKKEVSEVKEVNGEEIQQVVVEEIPDDNDSKKRLSQVNELE